MPWLLVFKRRGNGRALKNFVGCISSTCKTFYD